MASPLRAEKITGQLTIKRSGWTEAAERELARLGKVGGCNVAWLRGLVEDEYAELLEVAAEGEPCGVVIIEKANGDVGPVAVVLVAAGNVPGADLLGAVLPALEKLARDAGCAALEFDTVRKGLGYRAAQLGYAWQSMKFRKALHA